MDADAAVHAPRNVNVGGALDVKSDAFVGGSVVVGGTVMGSGAYIDSSDARFKRDLAVLDGAACLGALRNGSLGAYAFSYKRDEFPARNFPARRDVGFVAQRVEEAFPSLVYDDADGFKHVAYGRAAPVLAAALAALAAKHDGLERRVARLMRSWLVHVGQDSPGATVRVTGCLVEPGLGRGVVGAPRRTPRTWSSPLEGAR